MASERQMLAAMEELDIRSVQVETVDGYFTGVSYADAIRTALTVRDDSNYNKAKTMCLEQALFMFNGLMKGGTFNGKAKTNPFRNWGIVVDAKQLCSLLKDYPGDSVGYGRKIKVTSGGDAEAVGYYRLPKDVSFISYVINASGHIKALKFRDSNGKEFWECVFAWNGQLAACSLPDAIFDGKLMTVHG